MKKRFKDFVDYYKNVGIVKIILFLLCIAIFIFEIKWIWRASNFFDYIYVHLESFTDYPFAFGYKVVSSVMIPVFFLLQIIMKKMNKKFIFLIILLLF